MAINLPHDDSDSMDSSNAIYPVKTACHPRCRMSRRRGSATIEFVLVFPILLVLILLILQFMLVMVGRMYVQYAAFAATRTAIVQIPEDYTDYTGEGVNEIDPDLTTTGKMAVIRHAASWALVPVAGRSDTTSNPIGSRSSELVSALDLAYAQRGSQPPNWVASMLTEKTNYAFEYTEVELLEYVRDGDPFFEDIFLYRTFGPQEDVTVRVRHQLALTVPYIRSLFQDGENESGPYTEVVALTTLTNEGVSPALPEEPSLPRNPAQ